MEQIDIAILGATPSEIFRPAEIFSQSESLEIAGNVFTRHIYRELRVLIGSTGIGKVNAAAITAAVLTRFSVMEVWGAGCAGGYRGAGLRIGDVLITSDSICGDEGVLHRGGVSGTEIIGIPLVRKGGRILYERFPLDGFETFGKAHALLPPGRYVRDGATDRLQPDQADEAGRNFFDVRYGPSLTVGMVSGDDETAQKRFQTYGALAENMEGSAVAQVCFLFETPFLECRGISNIAGIRDKGLWDLSLAAGNSHAVLGHLLADIAASRH
jgi:futalosine hydrolase